MLKIERKHLLVQERFRSGDPKSYRDKDLRASIETKGLLHPVVVAGPIGDNYILVAGGRRLAHIDWFAEDKINFVCHKEIITPGFVPVTLIKDISEADLKEAELEENEYREPLSWQDSSLARCKIFELRKALDPNHTVPQTAEISKTAGSQLKVDTIRKVTLEAIKVVQHMHDPMIAHARTKNEAYSLALRKEEAGLKALMVKQRKTLPVNIKVIEGDNFAILPTLEASSIDLIVADPPYGVSAGAGGFRARTIHHHNYEDDPTTARRINELIIREGFRLTKPRSNLFIFCDIDLWSFLESTSRGAGWVPFRTPIIWAKSETEGLAPWGSQGFRRTYDIIFYATKGQRGLVQSPVDILRHARVGRAERDYAAAKPVSLIKELITAATMEGELVLDPCCGSGSTLVAAKELKRSAIGIEKDKNAINLTMAKLEEQNDAQPKVSDL